jgi:hypothetical protein
MILSSLKSQMETRERPGRTRGDRWSRHQPLPIRVRQFVQHGRQRGAHGRHGQTKSHESVLAVRVLDAMNA